MNEGCVPSTWKHAVITPVPKVKPVTKIADLRPIYVTPVFSRITERLVMRKLFHQMGLILPETFRGLLFEIPCIARPVSITGKPEEPPEGQETVQNLLFHKEIFSFYFESFSDYRDHICLQGR